MENQVVLNSIWVLLSAFLVFFMHAGFALVESGFSRRKNAVIVLLKNVGVVSIASIAFYLIGFGFMFGDSNGFIGMSGFAPAANEAVAGAPDSLPLFVFLFFQLVFAATATTIVSGAVAGRARVATFFLFTVVASTLIYPVIGHWVWGGGWLAEWGFVDFAGSTVVHATGGAMAVAAVIAVGPRLGRFSQNGNVNRLSAHNVPLAALGVIILWLGWFGFNGGSTLEADVESIGTIILVTNLSASAGFLAALFHLRLRTSKMDFGVALNGALAGLVAITAGCAVIGPMESMVVGLIGGIIVVEGTFLLERFKMDDPVGAIPVHLMNGLFGTIAVGLFANSGDTIGLFHGGGATLLIHQVVGTTACAAFAGLTGVLVWFGMKKILSIRVPTQHELEGLDISECGHLAYGIDDIVVELPKEVDSMEPVRKKAS